MEADVMMPLDDGQLTLIGITLFAATVNGALGYGFSSLTVVLFDLYLLYGFFTRREGIMGATLAVDVPHGGPRLVRQNIPSVTQDDVSA